MRALASDEIANASTAPPWSGLRNTSGIPWSSAAAKIVASDWARSCGRSAAGSQRALLDRMQTRAELYETIGYHDYEALDASIVETVVPQGMPQRD